MPIVACEPAGREHTGVRPGLDKFLDERDTALRRGQVIKTELEERVAIFVFAFGGLGKRRR